MFNTIKLYKNLIIIIIVFAISVSLLILKVRHNLDYVPDWDESLHLWMGIRFNQAIFPTDVPRLVNLLRNSNQLYPPLYYFILSFWYELFGTKNTTAIFVNTPFILILMISLYKLGEFFGYKKAGLLAAILTPLLPIFVTLQERNLLDYASASMFILSFYILFKTSGFTNRKYSLYFGALILLDLLIKWPFVIPGIPFIIYAIYNLYNNRGKFKLILTNITISLLICSPGIIWYIVNYYSIQSTLNFFWDPNGIAMTVWNFPKGISSENILLYLYTFPVSESGVGLIILIFFYTTSFLKNTTRELLYLNLSVIVTISVLTYLNDKSPFYLAYTYPLIMLVTMIKLINIKTKLLKIFAILFFSGAILTNYLLSISNSSRYDRIGIKVFEKNTIIFPNYYTKFLNEKWPTKTVVDKYLVKSNCQDKIMVFPDNRFFNTSNIRYYLGLNGEDTFPESAYLHYNPTRDSEFNVSYLTDYNCIVTKSGDPGYFSSSKVMLFINKYLDSDSGFYKEQIDTPDNSQIFVYIKKQNV